MTDADKTAADGMVWLPIAEAASRLGLSPAALRSRLRRKVYSSRRGNDGRTLVELPADLKPAAVVEPDLHGELLVEVDQLKSELYAAKIAVVKAEAERDAARETIADLRVQLADARRPPTRLWERIFGPRR